MRACFFSLSSAFPPVAARTSFARKKRKASLDEERMVRFFYCVCVCVYMANTYYLMLFSFSFVLTSHTGSVVIASASFSSFLEKRGPLRRYGCTIATRVCVCVLGAVHPIAAHFILLRERR